VILNADTYSWRPACGKAGRRRAPTSPWSRACTWQLHALHARVSEHDAALHELHVKEIHNAFSSRIDKGRLEVYTFSATAPSAPTAAAVSCRAINKSQRWVEFDSCIGHGRIPTTACIPNSRLVTASATERVKTCTYRRCRKRRSHSDATFTGQRLAREIEETKAQHRCRISAKSPSGAHRICRGNFELEYKT